MADTIKAKITTLSPVHVGSGKGELRVNDDFVADGTRIYVIDHEKMFELAGEDVWLSDDIDVSIRKLLKQNQYKECAKYSLNREGDVQKIYEQMKDSHHLPYIPGSSIKGAIRTALAYAMVENKVADINIDNMGSNPRTADNSLDGRLFGSDPNHDMMRALHVSDTQGAEDSLVLRNVVLYTISNERLEAKDRKSFSFNMEVIPEGKELEFAIKLDSHLLRDDVSKRLGFDVRRKWLKEFPIHCNTFAEALITSEESFYMNFKLTKILGFYRKLKELHKQIDRQRQFFLQMSWGTGWTAKTVGMAMDEVFYDVVDKYKLDKGRKHDEFPKTRRLVERGNVPEMPLGWVRVDLM